MTPIDAGNNIPLSARIITRGGEATQGNVVPAASDPSLVTPEDVNSAVDRAEQRVDEAREAQDVRREDARSFVVQLNGQQQQQDQIDLYLSVVTGETVDTSTGVSAGTLIDAGQNLRRTELADAIVESDLPGPRERQQQELLERIGEAVGERPSIQPIIDTSV